MPKWEYCYALRLLGEGEEKPPLEILLIQPGMEKAERLPGDGGVKSYIDLLNRLGADGWEAVSHTTMTLGTMSVLLKRQVRTVAAESAGTPRAVQIKFEEGGELETYYKDKDEGS